MIKRRQFIAGLGGAAAWPMAAWAQQPAMPVIGVLSTAPSGSYYVPPAFFQGLGQAGYVDGRSLVIEYRWADEHNDRLLALAADLVRRRVAVILATSTPAAVAAKAATTTIPIVFVAGVDPVASGLVASLNRPGGNATGIVNLGALLAPKRLQLLRELIPDAAAFGVLADRGAAGTRFLIPDLQSAARTLGRQLVVVYAGTDSDLETAFASFSQQRVGAVLVSNANFFNQRTAQLAALAIRHGLPSIFPFPEQALTGGLMSYGSSAGDTGHQLGIYAGRILKGEKPADLPVEQPTKFQLVINLKTAKALGLTIPETLLATADEVIQ
jgi:putative tryptophan/tyrosine transport system substrate-binding protein